MGMDPLSLGLIMGGVSAAGSLVSGISQKNQQRVQAQNLEQQAAAQAAASQIEAEGIDRRKAQIRRDYEQMQGRNAASLGAGNVDLSSGSAMDVAQGNANLFAQDVGANAYEAALAKWRGLNQAKALQSQADQLTKQSNNYLPTLLDAGLSGISGFMSGFGRNGRLPSQRQERYWDRALGQWSSTMPRH